MSAFEELGILPEIAQAVEELGWQLPTDIQSEAIPLILGGGDVLMAAETGSGKTGAFSLPVVQIVYEIKYITPKDNSSKNPDLSNDVLLSFIDRHPLVVLSNDYLSFQSKNFSWAGIRANKGVTKNVYDVNSNKFYYEIKFLQDGLARFGWSFCNANLELGKDAFGFGYGSTAKKSNSGNFDNYGVTFGNLGDILGTCLDLDKNEISFTKNGKNLGVAFSLQQKQCNESIFIPAICIKDARCSVNFIQSPNCSKTFLPSGFKWVGDLKCQKLVANPNVQKITTKKKTCSGPQAIIIEPSRELAEQTLRCINDFKKYLPNPIKELMILGGISSKQQIESLKNGVDIIVATPHRLDDLVASSHISLDNCSLFIIDEIDALLQQNNLNLLINLYSKIPKMFDYSKRLQLIVCSATLHNIAVKKFAEKLMHFPTWVDLKGEDSIPDTVHHVLLRVDPRKMTSWKNAETKIITDSVHEKDNLNFFNPTAETYSEALKILKGDLVIKAINILKMDQAIIFCRTKIDCDNLEKYFNLNNKNNSINVYSCVCLHSDRAPAERTSNLSKFREKKVKFLICTDVAARGIDIKGVPFVIQVTLSDDKANYLHRIGRVGRAERMGLAISLVSCVPEKVWYHSCSSRGKNCNNTKLKTNGGCCIWFNELEIITEIEEHLKCTIQEISEDFQIETNEYDGKVIYGSKKTGDGTINYQNHAEELKNLVSKLSALENKAQMKFLEISSLKPIKL